MSRIKVSQYGYGVFALLTIILTIGSAFLVNQTEAIRWNPELLSLIKIAGGLTLILWGLSLRFSLAHSLVLFFAGMCIATGFTTAFFGVAVFWALSWVIGYGLIAACKPKHNSTDQRHSALSDSQPSLAEILSVGYIAMALGLTVMAYTPYNAPFYYLIIFLLPVLWGLRCYKKTFVKTQEHAPKPLSAPLAQSVINLPLFFILSLLLAFALLPDLGSDSIAAYRGIIMELMAAGEFNYNPESSSIRLITLSGIWPHAFTAVISGDYESAKLFNYSVLLVTSLIAVDLVARKTSKDKAAMMLAVPVLLSVPMMAHITNSAFYDNSVVFLMTAFILFTLRLKDSFTNEADTAKAYGPSTYYSVILGLLAGLLILTKYTTLYIAPVMGLFIIVTLWRKNNVLAIFKTVTLIALLAGAVWSAFLAFVYFQTGNPVFPYYNHIFQSEYFPPVPNASPHKGYMALSLLWDVTFKTQLYAGAGARNGAVGLIAVIWVLTALFFSAFYKRLKNASLRLPIVGLGAFLLGLILISALQNSPRYLVILFPFLLLPLALQFKAMGLKLATFLSTIIIAVNVFLLPNFGWSIIVADGIFKANHANIIEAYRPLRTASDRLSDTYGRSGNVLFFHSGDAGFIGRAYIDGWYDQTTATALKALDYGDKAALQDFLQNRHIDAVAISSVTLRSWKNTPKRQILKTLQSLSTSTEAISGVVIYHINPDIAFPTLKTLDSDKFDAPHTLLSAHQITDFIVEFDYTCRNLNAFRLITIKPSGQWAHYRSYVPDCDQESASQEPDNLPNNNATIRISHRDLNPENRYILMSIPAPDSSFEILGGTIYTRGL